MRISTFLPHVGVYGGVRRMLELGNAWTAMGHEVTLHHPGGQPPRWLPFAGSVGPLDRAHEHESDLAVCSDSHTYDAFRAHRARRHVYYCVIERDPGVGRAIADRHVLLAANSGPLSRSLQRRSGRRVLDGIGGIHLRQFHPDPVRRAARPLRVLLNGRRSRPKKGTDVALEALAGLEGHVPEFEVVLFDTLDPRDPRDPRVGARLPRGARYVLDPTQQELVLLYQSAHVLVAAERKAGWCNVAIEAMACGAAVVCTRSGTTDFARHQVNALVVPFRHPFFIRRAVRRLLTDAALRERLSAAAPDTIVSFSWDRLAAKLLSQIDGG